MDTSDLRLLNFGDLSFNAFGMNSSLNPANTSDFYHFPLYDFYQNYSDRKYFSEQNLTALEDFEVFDGRDLMNVVAYSIMSLGKEKVAVVYSGT